MRATPITRLPQPSSCSGDSRMRVATEPTESRRGSVPSLWICPAALAVLIFLSPLSALIHDVEFPLGGNYVVGVWGTQAALVAATGPGARRRNAVGIYTSRTGFHYYPSIYCLRIGRLRWAVFLDASLSRVREG